MTLIFNDQLTRRLAEYFRLFLSDPDRLGQFEPAVIEPQRRHEMERHVSLKHGLVAASDRKRPLAPVGRIRKPDRIAGARVFLKSQPLQRIEESSRNLLAGVSFPGFGK